MQVEKSLLYQRILFISFWIRATFGFISDELMPFAVSYQPLIFLAFDMVIVALGIITIRKKWDLIILITFILITYYTTCIYNKLSLIFFINGLRDFIPYLFIIPIFNYFFAGEERKEEFVINFDRQLYLFLIIQAPCLAWQFLKYGANDHGGGSLGNWNSGIITTLIYLISYYLIQKRIEPQHYISSLWKNKIYIILLIPSFLNETKISFIFLPLYFLFLLPIDKKLFIRILIMIPVLFLVMWGAVVAYLTTTGGYMGNVFSYEYYSEGYLMNDESVEYAKWLVDADNGETEDVPRFTKLILLDLVNEENPGHFITGFGVGTFKGGTTLESTAFAKEYEWLLIGSIPYLFHIIIQLGLVGVILISSFWIIKLGFNRFNFDRNIGLQLYLILALLLILFYNDSLRSPFMSLVIMYLLEQSWQNKSNKTVQHNNRDSFSDIY